jgi:DNA-binding response OmpR family regulator
MNPAAAARILLVDDEPAIVEAVAYNLRQQGYVVTAAGDAETALRVFKTERPDVILLDVMLPSASGFEVCRRIRQSDARVPILMLTARVAEADRVQGLEIGADDYLVKPFGMRELVARVKALLRRSSSGADEAAGAMPAPALPLLVCRALGLVLDGERREARLNDKPLALSRKEWDLLAHFLSHPGRVFDRQTLLARVWGEDAAFVDERTVDVHVRWLREKIEPAPGKPEYLLTLRGVGYKFQA